MRILVTGGAGFIGSHFVRMLLADEPGTDASGPGIGSSGAGIGSSGPGIGAPGTGFGAPGAEPGAVPGEFGDAGGPAGPGGDGQQIRAVTVLDALTYAGNTANLADVADDPRYTFVHGDIRDEALTSALVAEHDAVVHFAAESHVDRSLDRASEFVSTNVQGTQTLLDALLRHSGDGPGIDPCIDSGDGAGDGPGDGAPGTPRGPKTLLHVSTDEVYGSIEHGSWPESHPLCPRSPYAASKASADLLVLAHHHTHGLDVRVTRCSNNYGPRQNPEKVIPLFTTRLLEGRTVPLYGDGSNVRDWLHVEDHCRALLLVLLRGRPGEVYNIGAGAELSNLRLTEALLEACGAPADRIERVADRKGHDFRYSVDSAKIRRELGWRPHHTFDDGLRRTVEWYRHNRAWWAHTPAGSGAAP